VGASEAEKDFSSIEVNPLWKLQRRCVYCDHCLPCPEEIEIGSLMKLLDAAEHRMSKPVASAYKALKMHASNCTRCSICMERCPFDVPVIERMDRAIEVFGQ
jgi:predicted aldo/keto reductase-like oxidoreductase